MLRDSKSMLSEVTTALSSENPPSRFRFISASRFGFIPFRIQRPRGVADPLLKKPHRMRVRFLDSRLSLPQTPPANPK